jgi:ribosomal protein S18 acetylase RimI-like enzyme
MYPFDYTIRSACLADLDRCHQIESIAYEGDEAATREKIKTRIERYPAGFMVVDVDGETAGFINSGCADIVRMSNREFKELIGHHPDGRHNVILSVAVHPEYQGRGISSILLVNYVLRMKRLKKESIQLVCRERHIPFYERFGFGYVRPSTLDHGGKSWHEMKMDLTHSSGGIRGQSVPDLASDNGTRT